MRACARVCACVRAIVRAIAIYIKDWAQAHQGPTPGGFLTAGRYACVVETRACPTVEGAVRSGLARIRVGRSKSASESGSPAAASRPLHPDAAQPLLGHFGMLAPVTLQHDALFGKLSGSPARCRSGLDADAAGAATAD